MPVDGLVSFGAVPWMAAEDLLSLGAVPWMAAEGFLSWLLSGSPGPDFRAARWIFLRGLGLVHLIAFMSLWVQVRGLIGRDGIVPIELQLDAVRERYGRAGYRRFPTLFWLRCDDRALNAACAAGAGLSILLVLDLAPPLVLLLLWALYLSFVTAGREFMAYQWDALLLEVTFLGALLAPWHLWPGGEAPAVPGLAVLLLWWTLFHLVFRSGVVKLRSGDASWRNLTALDYHFFTQPLPTWISWHVHRLPGALQNGCVVATLAIEIGLPLLIFGPEPARLAACAGIVFLQVLILVTGNYNFFNLLTIALAALLLNDSIWTDVLPAAVVGAAGLAGPAPAPAWMQVAAVPAVGLPFLALSVSRLARTFVPDHRMPHVVRRALAKLEPFQTLNSYGLFSVMTTARPEIVVEGSRDGESWWEYEFRYKPGDPSRRPRFVEPHQPRLDWQMWVAALGGMDRNIWFRPFLWRLLEGSPPVLRLLKRPPFHEPPQFVRATLYEYRFTTPEERARTGDWWRRARVGEYSPVYGRQVRVTNGKFE